MIKKKISIKRALILFWHGLTEAIPTGSAEKLRLSEVRLPMTVYFATVNGGCFHTGSVVWKSLHPGFEKSILFVIRSPQRG